MRSGFARSRWCSPRRARSRRAVLEAAGVPVEVAPGAISTSAASRRDRLRASAGEVARAARAREGAGGRGRDAGALVLGADQTLALGEQRFAKPADRAAAREQLQALRGRTHELHSGRAVVRDGDGRCSIRSTVARLTMRAFADDFLDRYLDAAGRGRDGERRRLSVGTARHSSCSSGSRATISRSSACRCCPLLDFLRIKALVA